MGKRVLCVGLLILFLACTNAFAGGSGNPVEPVKAKSELCGIGAVAFEYNLVKERMNDLNDSAIGPDNVEIEDVSQAYGKIIWGKDDKRNLYLNVGVCDYDFKFSDNGIPVEVDLQSGIYVGVGANMLLPLKKFDYCSVDWGGDIQINGFLNDVNDVSRGSETILDSEGLFYGFDGEASVYLTCKYDIEKIKTSLIPYAGAYYSLIDVGTIKRLEYKSSSTEYEEDIWAAFDALSFGVLLGLDVNITEYAVLNVEGRFIGETAVTTGATIKF